MRFSKSTESVLRVIVVGLLCLFLGCVIITIGLSLVIGFMTILVFIVKQLPEVVKSGFMIAFVGIGFILLVLFAIGVGYESIEWISEKRRKRMKNKLKIKEGKLLFYGKRDKDSNSRG